MNCLQNAVIIIATFVAGSFLTSIPARAQNFSTTLHATYSIDDKGTTQATLNFSIQNNTSTEYVTQYAFEIPGSTTRDIRVKSNGLEIEPKLTQGRNRVTVQLQFPDKVVGRGKSREFQVDFTNTDIATKIGKTLEVSIPKLSNPSIFSTYTVTLKVPRALGKPSNVTPTQFTSSIEDEKSVMIFQSGLQESGISASFGHEQFARLRLLYHLQNTNSTKSKVHIALPPDTQHQRVFYDAITPEPTAISSDSDGNWIASYELETNQRLDVTAQLHVQTQSTPQENAQLLSKKPDTRYTRPQPFWESDDPEISRVSRDLSTPEAIYAYVVETLHYDYSKSLTDTKRLGAKGALHNPSGSVCTEFTDLFIALARRKGIPARSILGYAYTSNTDLRPTGIDRDELHSWPEYWDERTGAWTAVDPTWGQTTGGIDYFHHIDFNRVVFATQGVSSTTPLPAGMYKREGQEGKDVEVEFVDKLPSYTTTFRSDLRIHPRTALGLSDTYAIAIKNTSLLAAYAVPVQIRIRNQDGTLEQTERITLIPTQEREIPVQLPRKGLLSYGSSTISVRVGNQEFTHELTLTTTIKQFLPFLILAFVVAGSVGICAYIARRLLVPRWRR